MEELGNPVINMAGTPLTREMLDDAFKLIESNCGIPTHMVLGGFQYWLIYWTQIFYMTTSNTGFEELHWDGWSHENYIESVEDGKTSI